MQEPKKHNHYFVDEAGDMTFFGKGHVSLIGTTGVSNHFMIGMVNFNEDLTLIRRKIKQLADEILADPYFKNIPSFERKLLYAKQFYFHATDDLPEVRMLFYKLIASLDCTFEVVVAPKVSSRFVNKHNKKESVFYADLLSHLLENKLNQPHIMTVARIGSTLKINHLQDGFQRAIKRLQQQEEGVFETKFIIENQFAEPLLNIADYFCWTVQRLIEKKENRFYKFIESKITRVEILWEEGKTIDDWL
jgi:hypothetical protein